MSYLTFDELTPAQQRQATLQFSGYRMLDYRYELGRGGSVLCGKTDEQREMIPIDEIETLPAPPAIH